MSPLWNHQRLKRLTTVRMRLVKTKPSQAPYSFSLLTTKKCEKKQPENTLWMFGGLNNQKQCPLRHDTNKPNTEESSLFSYKCTQCAASHYNYNDCHNTSAELLFKTGNVLIQMKRRTEYIKRPKSHAFLYIHGGCHKRKRSSTEDAHIRAVSLDPCSCTVSGKYNSEFLNFLPYIRERPNYSKIGETRNANIVINNSSAYSDLAVQHGNIRHPVLAAYDQIILINCCQPWRIGWKLFGNIVGPKLLSAS